MYLSATENHWAADIEADNLLEAATRIWCATVCNLVTKEERFFLNEEEFRAFRDEHPNAIFVGHNFLAYDAPMLNRFWGARIPAAQIVDTFVLSQLYNPNFQGGHSLDIWGQRLRYPKGDFHEFDRYSPEMLDYCRRDTRLTGLLFIRLTDRMRAVGFTEEGAELEHLAWNIIQNKQKRNGFPFNKPKAEALYAELRQREEELKNEIYQLWPPQLLPVGEFKAGRRKDGSYTKQYERHLEQYPRLEWADDGVGYTAYDYVEFNLGSPSQRIDKLLELGWEPINKTKKGNPKVDEDELLTFAEVSGKREVAALAKWIVVNSRANMVNTWLEAYNESTGAIHGNLFIASTLRYKHSSPNSANIPAVRLDKEDNILYGEDGAYTYEARDLWDCGDPDEWDLVGIDAKGIQLRILAQYLDNPAFTEAILSEDPHSANQQLLGLPTRALTKTVVYASLMGAGDGRVAITAGVSLAEAKEAKAKFFSSIPTLPRLISDLQAQLARTGRIKLCDGTPIIVPSDHMVIPYLLQGDESRLMKQALVGIDTRVRENRWSSSIGYCANVHDELQVRVKTGLADAFIETALPEFLKAGECFNYKVPIEGNAVKGKTWAQTH